MIIYAYIMVQVVVEKTIKLNRWCNPSHQVKHGMKIIKLILVIA